MGHGKKCTTRGELAKHYAAMSDTHTSKPLLEVKNLRQHFPITAGLLRRQTGTVKAVDGVDFNLLPQENLGLVGESGCGKTTLGRTILHLYRPTEGQILFKDVNLTRLRPSALRALRPKMQMIFQDPQDSLNPRMTVGSIIAEPLDEHSIIKGKERSDRVEELLEAVGLNPRYTNRYPHEFSGGQRQRIGIARALGLNPEFIICDEPIAALDVSIQAQVINLLEDLQEKLGLTYLFISHDLGMIRHISKRVAVMYLGKIVELGPAVNCTAARNTPTPRPCFLRCHYTTPGEKQNESALSSQAMSQAPPIHPRGARFGPVAPWQKRAAPTQCPNPRIWVQATGWPVIWWNKEFAVDSDSEPDCGNAQAI